MTSSAASKSRLRQQRIVQMTQQNAGVSVDELAQKFGVTTQTIRRDINL